MATESIGKRGGSGWCNTTKMLIDIMENTKRSSEELPKVDTKKITSRSIPCPAFVLDDCCLAKPREEWEVWSYVKTLH